MKQQLVRVRGKPMRSLNKRQKMQVKRIAMGDVERKHFDEYQIQTVSSTAVLNELAGDNIIQGTDQFERVGDKISLEKLEIYISVLAEDKTNFLRYIIFQYKDVNDPTIDDILKETTDYTSPYNYDTRQSYKILKDRTFSLTLEGPACAQRFHRISKGIAKSMIYRGTVAQKNSLWILLISDSSAVTHPTFEFHARTFYTDK